LVNEAKTLANMVVEVSRLHMHGLVANLHRFYILSVRASMKVE